LSFKSTVGQFTIHTHNHRACSFVARRWTSIAQSVTS